MVPRKRRVESFVGQRAAVHAAFPAAALTPVLPVAELLHHVPLARYDLPVFPRQTRFFDRAIKRPERGVGTVPPRRFMRAELPRSFHDVAQRTIAAADEIFHG